VLDGAHAAAVDLAGAQRDQLDGLGGDAGALDDLAQRLQRVHRAGEQERRVRQAGLGDHGLHGRRLLAGHTGGGWRVNAMTRHATEM
jgi:hypothetical protein